MSERTIFRRLVTKQFMPYHDYGTLHEFKNVFYKSAFSYKCCTCAFEQEFLLYIDGEGNINEDIYQKLEQSLVDGKCPHVDLVASDWIRDSSTKSLHIALAVGTEEVVKGNFRGLMYRSCGLFQLNLLDIAFMKTRLNTSHCSDHPHMLPPFECSLCHSKNWLNRHLKYMFFQTGEDTIKALYHGASGSSECIVKEISFLEKIISKHNELLIVSILERLSLGSNASNERHEEVQCTFESYQTISEKYGMGTDSVKCCFGDRFPLETFGENHFRYILEVLVVYDQPQLLEKIMEMVSDHLIYNQLYKISKLSRILQRNKCKDVFERHGVLSTEELSDEHEVEDLIDLLKQVGISSKEEIMTALRQFQALQDVRGYIGRKLTSLLGIPCIAAEILNVGVDFFNEDIPFKNNLFVSLLWELNKDLYNYTHVTDTIKTHIWANPEIDHQYGVVELAFVQDELMYTKAQDMHSQIYINTAERIEDGREYMVDLSHALPLTGTYITDMNEHGVMGHDEIDFALNFIGPFLLECGFPATMEQLEKALDMNLHPAEQANIRSRLEQLEEPKCLDILCRETLRKSFRGLKLHRFLDYSNCPRKIKDFVLLKYLLQPSQRNS